MIKTHHGLQFIRFRPLLLSIFLTVVSLFSPLPASAFFDCRSLFEPASTAKERHDIGRLVELFQPLADPKFNASTRVNRAQQAYMIEMALTPLLRSRADLAHAEKNETNRLQKEKIAVAVRGIEDAISFVERLKKARSLRTLRYKDLFFTVELAVAYSNEVSHILHISRENEGDAGLGRRLQGKFSPKEFAKTSHRFPIWGPHRVYLPTTLSLSIFDFNQLVGTGIFPVGIAYGDTPADGLVYDSYVFFYHDVAHSGGDMPEMFVNAQQREFWTQLLRWANSPDPHERALRHAVLFFNSHEFSFIADKLRDGAIRRIDPSDHIFASAKSLEDKKRESAFVIASRLKVENFWDVKELSEISELEERLFHAELDFEKQWNHLESQIHRR